MNRHHPLKLTRRGALCGAGAALALPFLESWRPAWAEETPAAVRPPLRLAIVTVAGGTVIEDWKPRHAGKLDKLPSILESLEPYKDRLTLVSGLSHGGKVQGCAHSTCARLHLSCGGEVSVDQVAARAIGDSAVLPSLEMGLTNHQTKFSYRDGTPLPYEMNPHVVFERLFKGRPPVVPSWNASGSKEIAAEIDFVASDSVEQGVIDAVLDQVGGLKKQLSHSDQHTLDQYLYSVRSVEKRLAIMERRQRDELRQAGKKARIPEFPPESHFKDYTNSWWIWRNPESHAEYIRIMSDLFVLAFQTDATRVITAALGEDNAIFEGVVTDGTEQQAHALEHNGNAPGNQKPNPVAREGCRQIHAWYTQLFAELVGKLHAIDEGGVSLLDNCAILYTSYMADGGHGIEDYPTLVVGNAQGKINAGAHLAYRVGTPVANLYTELLNCIDDRIRSFGDSHTAERQSYNGRLPGFRG